MAETWGALAQSAPSSGVLTDAYDVPAGTRTTVFVTVCNRGADASVRLAHAIGGASDAVAQYLLFDFGVGANRSVSTEKMLLAAGDVLRVSSSSGDVSFTIYGIQEDA